MIPDLAFGMLSNFLKASRDKSQSDIIKNFLWIVIKRAGISESGSVLVYNPDDGKLHLFNEDGFLFQQGFLDETKPWKAEFSPYEGLAGLAFATAEKQVTNDVQNDPRFAHDGGGGIGHDLHADQHFPARAAFRCRLLSQHSRHDQFR